MAKPQNRTVSVMPYFERPESDAQQLFNFQFEFKKGNAQALAGMYKKLYEVAYKTINNRSRTNERIAALSATERQKKAHDAATYIIEQYLIRPAFVITDSITGYLYMRINWELYGKDHQYKRDQMVVYTDKLPERNGARIKYKYLVKDVITGIDTTYESVAELYLNPAFKGLRKKRLVESIRTGRKWKNYIFDLLEVIE
ncbi:hypothetical protein [uncultured Treponema sp.]|uniref:hypothetical protein n=1 Tax=uncultured Treponema sp. TaxID=162155 RepID=UPI0025FEC7C6|nr:hypothetical protein [uncultured Treponema sp.]